MRARLLYLSALLLLSCSACNREKELDLKAFSITVPKEWKYVQKPGVDSFYSEIALDEKTTLSFDYSDMGYANHLISSEKEYLEPGKWIRDCIPCLSDNLFNTKQKILKPSEEQKRKYPKADYIAYVTKKDGTSIFPITIPTEIKNHHISIDTIGEYAIKTIYPVVAGKGMTGVYFNHLKSDRNFQMNGRDLSLKQQQALKAFKTIVLAP